MSAKNPIVITGSHRSGTTWLANMLGFANNTQIIDEPFNPESWQYSLDGYANFFYTYAPQLDEDLARSAYQKVLKNKTRFVYKRRNIMRWLSFLLKRLQIIKDPLSAMYIECFSNNFATDVIIITRHPMAFINSLIRMGWNFPFNHFLKQEQLMQDFLYKFEDDIRFATNQSLLIQGAVCWKCVYYVLNEYSNRNNYTLVRHEDLSTNPVGDFKNLYKKFNLPWTEEVKQKINSYTSPDNPTRAKGEKTHQMKRDSASLAFSWKDKFNRESIETVYNLTKEVADNFYTDDEWFEEI